MLAAVLILLAAVALRFAGDIGRTGTGGGHDPGPRFFPVLLSMVLLAFGVVQAVLGIVWQTDMGKAVVEDRAEVPDARRPNRRWLVLLAVLVVYVVAMDWIGFSASTLLMAVGLMVWLGNRWWASIVIAVLMVVLVRMLFVVLFRVQLPAGQLGLPF